MRERRGSGNGSASQILDDSSSDILRRNLDGPYRGIIVDMYGSMVSLMSPRCIWNDRTRRNSAAIDEHNDDRKLAEEASESGIDESG